MKAVGQKNVDVSAVNILLTENGWPPPQEATGTQEIMSNRSELPFLLAMGSTRVSHTENHYIHISHSPSEEMSVCIPTRLSCKQAVNIYLYYIMFESVETPVPPPACVFIARGGLEMDQGNSWAAAATSKLGSSASPWTWQFCNFGLGVEAGVSTQGRGNNYNTAYGYAIHLETFHSENSHYGELHSENSHH